MRYAQGGGLTDERRAFREKLRMEASGSPRATRTRSSRMTCGSASGRCSAGGAWSQDGPRALASTGPASLPLLNDELFAVLEQELAKGAVAHGWPDQTWTLSRIKTLIGRRFHKSYTVQGVAALLKRHGWSCQMPARRAIERDEAAVAGWVKETWPSVEGPWRRSMHGSSSRTRPASR
jgi:transposase